MSYVNTRGAAGTAAALRATNPGAVLPPGVLTGPDGTQDLAATGPGAEIDARLDSLDARIGQLESAEAGEGDAP